MKTTKLLVALVLGSGAQLIQLIQPVHAQDLGNCPAGMRTTFQNGKPTCMYDDAPDEAAASPQPAERACDLKCSMMDLDFVGPTPVGSGTWAAVVTTTKGRIAESGNHSTPEGAIRSAIKECQEEAQEAGIEAECIVRTTFDKGFAAVVRDMDHRTTTYIGHGDTRGSAKAGATAKCRQAARNCGAKAYIVRNDGNVDSIY